MVVIATKLWLGSQIRLPENIRIPWPVRQMKLISELACTASFSVTYASTHMQDHASAGPNRGPEACPFLVQVKGYKLT